MKIIRLEEFDKDQIVSSYAIPDIYNLIWNLSRYAIERDAKNIQLKLCCEKASFELHDDGDSLNLNEMAKESILLKNIRNICEYSIRTRSRLGLFSEHIDNNNRVTKVEADRVYRNVFIISNLFKSQSLRCKIALEGLKNFERTLKVVVIENCKIDWIYECEESKSRFNVKMIKTKLGRYNALFKGKHEIIFETGIKGIETLATSENYKEHPIILFKGLPYETNKVHHKNAIYINYSEMDGDKKFLKPKPLVNEKIPNIKLGIKCLIESRSDKFKGARECLESFKVRSSVVCVAGQSRDFLTDLTVIGQFDKKAILAKRTTSEFEEIWMFDQHACAERINLENLMKSQENNLSRDEMNMKACRSAVKFGDELDFYKQESIIKELEQCHEPFHCAHGRPTCWLLAKLKK